MQEDLTVGQKIKQIRLSFGDTLEEFGKRKIEGTDISLNANRSLISAWENGRYTPSPERLKIIAELGNISVSELLSGNDKDDDIYKEAINILKSNNVSLDKASLKDNLISLAIILYSLAIRLEVDE